MITTSIKNKPIRSLIFSTMCILTLLCIVTALKNDIFRDTYGFFIIITNLFGLIFLTLLSGNIFFKTEEPTAPMHYFILFLINIYLATFFSALVNSYFRIPHHALQLTIFATLCYFFTILIYLTIWLYQKQFLRESAITRAVSVMLCITVLLYTAALIINLFRPFFFIFTDDGKNSGDVTDYISISTGLFCLLLLCIATFTSNLNQRRQFSFLCCIFAPALFGTLSVNEEFIDRSIYICGLIILMIFLPLSLIFFNAYEELENEALRNEKEQTRLRLSAMISQMQPHFLYNSLAVIAALCEEDPKLAAQATNEFSNYLRENMDFADKSSPISFLEELKHIKTYVWLEKLRFPNKLSVEYDIKATSFSVPALSIQPMVENAIKHGICKAKNGGTVRLCSCETDQNYIVTVTDNGTGFDASTTTDEQKRHLGIKNSRYRIREMLGGSLDIVSSPGNGTTVTIRIPKSID